MTSFEYLLCAQRSGAMPFSENKPVDTESFCSGCKEECESRRNEPDQVLASRKKGRTLVSPSASLYTSCCP